MPDRPAPLTPELLAQLLEKLEDVMSEAERLKQQVNRQLADQRRSQQQELTPALKRKGSKQR